MGNGSDKDKYIIINDKRSREARIANGRVVRNKPEIIQSGLPNLTANLPFKIKIY